MASVFADESSDELGKRVFAIAGLIGSDEQWNSVIPKWVSLTSGREFHAAEWESEFANDPDPTKHQDNCRTYAQLTQLIAGSGLHGWGVAIDLVAYRENFPHVNRDYAYHKCFIETTDRLVDKASQMGLSELKFTFDHRQGEGCVRALYTWMMQQPEWCRTGILFDHEIIFTSRKAPQIQAADLLARETMKFLDNMIGPKKRPMRKSFQILSASGGRLRFDFLMREYFEDMKRKLPEASKRVYGVEERDFHDWLQQNNMQDNLENRIRFGRWLDARKLKGTTRR